MGLDAEYRLVEKPSANREGIQSIYGGFYDGSMVADYNDEELYLLRPAAFQACFPIQVMDSNEVLDFARAFKTIHKELDADAVAYTEIYFRPRGSEPNAAWRPVMDVITRQKDAPASLSPFDQIRVLIVLKKQDKNGRPIKGIFPVSLKLKRTDGFDISGGPEYKGLTRMLTAGDRPDPNAEKWEWDGYYGCVIEPFFMLYGAYMPGTKPMAGKIAMGFLQGGVFGKKQTDEEAAQAYYEGKHLSDMRYGFEMDIAGRIKTDVRVQSHWQAEKKPRGDLYLEPADDAARPLDRRADFPVDVDTQRRHPVDKAGRPTADKQEWIADEDRLLSKHLLTSRTASATYPPLFLSSFSDPLSAPFAVPLLCLGDADCVVPLPEFQGQAQKVCLPDRLNQYRGADMTCRLEGMFKQIVTVNHFDWRTPVSFILLAAVKHLDTKAFTDNGLDWRTVPFHVGLEELTGINTRGAVLSSRLHYVGTAKSDGARCVLSKDDGLPWKRFPKLARLRPLVEDPALLTALLQPQHYKGHELKLPDTSFHLFAAHLALDYDAPTGARVNSLRPFGGNRINPNNPTRDDGYGMKLDDPPYRLALRGLRTVKDTDLSLDYLSRRGRLLNLEEFEFHFSGLPTGWAYDDGRLPWMQPPRPPQKAKNAGLDDLKKWIEKQPEKLRDKDALFE